MRRTTAASRQLTRRRIPRRIKFCSLFPRWRVRVLLNVLPSRPRRRIGRPNLLGLFLSRSRSAMSTRDEYSEGGKAANGGLRGSTKVSTDLTAAWPGRRRAHLDESRLSLGRLYQVLIDSAAARSRIGSVADFSQPLLGEHIRTAARRRSNSSPPRPRSTNNSDATSLRHQVAPNRSTKAARPRRASTTRWASTSAASASPARSIH